MKDKGISLQFINGNLTLAMTGSRATIGVPGTLEGFLEQRANMCKVEKPEESLKQGYYIGNDIPISGDMLKEKTNIPEFNPNICHEEGSYVKEKVNGEYVLGIEHHLQVSSGNKSYFEAYDKTPGTHSLSKEQMQAIGELMMFSIPYVGPALLVAEAVSGKDVFTGRKLSVGERAADVLFLGLGEISRLGRSAISDLDEGAKADRLLNDNAAVRETEDASKGTGTVSDNDKIVSGESDGGNKLGEKSSYAGDENPIYGDQTQIPQSEIGPSEPSDLIPETSDVSGNQDLGKVSDKVIQTVNKIMDYVI
ncbi:pre-toxin TG domain-containing protein [Clostridium sp.]|uniref:pre-toxin TG domain-containing protein n=1 Tax=Clostridium sp. TaxID=1506 RepID=UPI00260E5153|nr:pre-toxin TG domain-containing protein [Clostridium sp.]